MVYRTERLTLRDNSGLTSLAKLCVLKYKQKSEGLGTKKTIQSNPKSNFLNLKGGAGSFDLKLIRRITNLYSIRNEGKV